MGAELDAKGEERPEGATVPGLGAPRAGTGTCVGESYRVVGLVRAVLESGERQRGSFALFHRHLHHEEAAAGVYCSRSVCRRFANKCAQEMVQVGSCPPSHSKRHSIWGS